MQVSVGYGWKRWNIVGIRAGTNTLQKVPADYADLLHTFRKAIITLRKAIITLHKASDIEPSQIVNMDQMMCRFDMPLNHTNNKKGAKTIRIKTTQAEKKGFTIALAAMAGGEKLPAVIIFKERGGSLGERVRRSLQIPANVRVRATTNGWMTAGEYYHWLQHVIGREEK